MIIEKNDYLKCINAACDMWANTKRGKWGSGVINSPNDEFRSERIGRLGEFAVAKILKITPDFKYVNGGTKFDLVYKNKLIEVKTSDGYSKYKIGMIRAKIFKNKTNSYKNIPLTSDIYLFCEAQDFFNEQLAYVCVIGWIPREKIHRIVPSRRDGLSHLNYEVKYKELNCIEELDHND